MTHFRFYVLWSGCESLSGKLHLADCLEFPRIFHKKVTCARNFDLVVCQKHAHDHQKEWFA